MTEIYHHKFSLFKLEEEVHNNGTFVYNFVMKSCFKYINTFDTLEKAKVAQKELKEKSIILPSY